MSSSGARLDPTLVSAAVTEEIQDRSLVELDGDGLLPDDKVPVRLTEPELDASFARKDSTPLNVRDVAFGATGDGMTDDTAALQAALDAAAAAGVARVLVPHSATDYVFSTLTLPDGVHLIGDGYSLAAQSPFGSAQYDAGGAFAPRGSVLRSTATAGTAILVSGVADPCRITGLCVVGPGAGTSTGIAFEDINDTTKHRLDDVMVCNFSRCWLMKGVEDSVFINLKARGCVTGFEFSGACNQNVWLNTEVQFSEGDAMILNDASTNQFIGVLWQNVTGRSALRITAGENNAFQGVYYESAVPPANLIEITAGSFNVVRDLWSSGVYAPSVLNGGGFNKFENWDGSAAFAVVAAGGANHIFEFVKGLTLTGAQATACTVFDETRLKLGPNADVRVNSGRRYYFETVGSGSFIGRNPGTADTEIGTPSGVLSLPTITAGTVAPAAGAAGALPATPAGYISVLIAGVARKIPVY